MKNPEHQSWPDGTRVRFADRAKASMKQSSAVAVPLTTPARGADAVYTVDNTDDSFHDVILRETGERYGAARLTRAEPASDHETLEEFFDRELPITFDPDRGSPRPEQGEQPSWHRGNWMQTYTGRQFYPLDPRPDEIHILDIAHSLSMQCRYNGHVREFMSVAEHCVLMSRLVSPENALWALLHDATEAYVGDMVRPLKLHMPEYRAVEDKVMLAIAEKFNIDPEMPAEVRAADTRILLDERAALLGAPAGDWGLDGDPYGIEIQAWSPAIAKQEYLLRYAELTGSPVDLRIGLCDNEADHAPHVHRSSSLGAYWCSADYAQRLPNAAERRRKERRP